jgi:hypothetical protein
MRRLVEEGEWWERYGSVKNADLARELGVSKRKLERMAHDMGLRKLGKREPWMDEVLRSEFGKTENAVLASRFGCCERSVSQWAHELGLKKDPEHWHRFRKGEKAFSGERERRRIEALWNAAAEERKLEREGLPPKRGWRRRKDLEV